MDIPQNEKNEVLDFLGKKVVEFRDRNLQISINYATGESNNAIKREMYNALADLTHEQRERVNDLLSETITTTIYDFLEMFEENSEEMKIILTNDDKEYNMLDISEKMGSEIARYDESGWIQKFSKSGRFVL